MSNQRSPKKKAFTLTELLVVVVVIGVLAAVSLPKFSKVLETRKTTEAEGVMRAIRTEQERRCALDKDYTVDFDKLSDLVAGAQTGNSYRSSHYQYTLGNTGGMRAASIDGLDYTLNMPSYADGRVCCHGEDCSKLNKDYPTCTELEAKADYVAPITDCVTERPGESPDPGNCTAPQPATETYHCCAQEGLLGTKTREYYCDPNTNQWQPGAWQGLCEAIPDPETYPSTKPCPGAQNPNHPRLKYGNCTRTYTCDPNDAGGMKISEECEWDDSECNGGTEYEWHWFVGGSVPSMQHITPPDTDDCDWGDAWAHNSWPLRLSWQCEHCNRIKSECSAATGIHMVHYWHCWQKVYGEILAGFTRRSCHMAICLPHKPGQMPDELVGQWTSVPDAYYKWYGSGMSVPALDPNNPYGGNWARNVNCHD